MIALSLYTSFDIPLSSPKVYALLTVFIASMFAFYLVEEYVAHEPVVPMSLLRKGETLNIMIAMGLYMATLMSRVGRKNRDSEFVETFLRSQAYIFPIYLKVVRSLSSQYTG
jgi:hypothetical protein